MKNKFDALSDEMLETVTAGTCLANESDLEGHFGGNIAKKYLSNFIGSKVIVRTRLSSARYFVGTIENVERIVLPTGLFGSSVVKLTLYIKSEDGSTASFTDDTNSIAIANVCLYV